MNRLARCISWPVIVSALCVATGLSAQTPAGKDSPFLPATGTAAAAGAAAPVEYELTGMTVVGKKTLLSVLRQSDKRSVWIPVGKSVSEITALSYDAQKDQAVIRVDGRELTLAMRKSAAVTGPAAHVPSPAVSTPMAAAPVAIPSKPMTAMEEKETEARMLVTDLLEIGQQQRKAYEEAQRRAALANKDKPAAPPAAASPLPPPAK